MSFLSMYRLLHLAFAGIFILLAVKASFAQEETTEPETGAVEGAETIETDDGVEFKAYFGIEAEKMSAYEMDEAPSQLSLGLKYLEGTEVEQNVHEGLSLIRMATAQGYIPAMKEMASIYEAGVQVDKDKEMAKGWADLAAWVEQHRPELEAMQDTSKTTLRFTGDGMIPGVESLKKLAETQDYPEVWYYLGMRYIIGTDNEKNPEEGIKALEKAAERGQVDAQVALGAVYVEGQTIGLDIEQNPAKAMKWFGLAAKAGRAEALHYMSKFYMTDDFGVKEDRELYLQNVRLAAIQGYANAEFDLGGYYQTRAETLDHLAALRWVRRAACHGHPKSLITYPSMLVYYRSQSNQVTKGTLYEGYAWYLLAKKEDWMDAYLAQNTSIEELFNQVAENLTADELEQLRALTADKEHFLLQNCEE